MHPLRRRRDAAVVASESEGSEPRRFGVRRKGCRASITSVTGKTMDMIKKRKKMKRTLTLWLMANDLETLK